MYTKLQKIDEINRLYKKYQKEIKLRSEKDIPDEDDDQPQMDEGTEDATDRSLNKKPSKNTPGNNGTTGKNNSKNTKRDRGNRGEDEPEEPEESVDDSSQPDKENDWPRSKLPKDKTGREERNDDNDSGEEEPGKPKKSGTRDTNEQFKKEKKELKTKKINDDESSYRAKRDLLREITSFKQYQSRRYLKRFRYLFKFQIRTERMFYFIKHCYRFKKIPPNFNKLMNKLLRMYTKLEEIHEINRLYKKYQKEIKPRSEKDIHDEDSDQPKVDKSTEEGIDGSSNKKPSKNTPGDNGSTEKSKSKNPKSDRRNRGEDESDGYEFGNDLDLNGIDNNEMTRGWRNPSDQPQVNESTEEGIDGSSNKKPSKNTPGDNGSTEKSKSKNPKSNRGNRGEDESDGYEFGNDLNGNDNNEMTRGWKNPGSDSKENTPQGKSRKPSKTGDSKDRGSSQKGSNNDNEADDFVNNSVEGRNTPSNSQRKYSSTVNIEDTDKTYLTKHLFLRYLSFEKYNIPRNTMKFYKLFGFRIRTKLVFRFIKHCYRFQRKPQNHNRVLNKLLNILRKLHPNALHKYSHFFFEKYDEGVTLFSNEDLRKPAMNVGNKSSNRFSARGENNQNKGDEFYKNKSNKDANGKKNSEVQNGKKSQTGSKPNNMNRVINKDNQQQGKPSKTLKNNKRNYGNNNFGMNFASYDINQQFNTLPNDNVNPVMDSLSTSTNQQSDFSTYKTQSSVFKDENGNSIPFNMNDNNNLQNQKANDYQMNTMTYNSNQQYDGSQYNMQYNNMNTAMDSMSTSMNQQPSFNTKFNEQGSNENERRIGTYDNYNSQNQETNSYKMNSETNNYNQQYDNIQSKSQYNMQYDNMNPPMDSTSTNINKQSSSNGNFNEQGSNANENLIPIDTYENYNSQNQETNSYQMNSMTYNTDQQYDKSESQNNMRYDNMNPMMDSMSSNMNQQPQSASDYNSQNYYTNDLQMNSMTSNMNQEQYNYQYNSFPNGLDSSFQDGSQNNMQGERVNNLQANDALYTNINQQYPDSLTAGSYSAQNDNFQTDSLPYEQNSLNDMGQTENADFSSENRQYDYTYQSDTQENPPFLEEGFD